jgi:hypothetical protein
MATLNQTTIQAQDATNTRIRRFGIYTGPASYATGGNAFTPAEVGMSRIEFLHINHPTNGSVVLLALYDYTNQKVKWFDLAGNETANATDLSAYTARYLAEGK